ncbi:hypothetical protein LSUE1_G000156 [Lachnellula suecica]|uniref:Peptidase A1 domain-containing protein n=1 Tax=Lachnellula suecica TaxID=602035 RepID=A0A8T9CMP7_9HELO|nr:hypothetical protein LSUE1_G000156 [Lachnellula suecica]
MHLLNSLSLALIFLPNPSAAFFNGGRSRLRAKRANSTSSLTPLVVPPSQYWDGVDGSWSSLALRVGSPAQSVRVVVSTNSPQTFVVLPEGCETVAVNPIPPDCASSRGGLFNPNTSTSWQEQGLFGINSAGVGFEANLGYTQYADYGIETLGLGFAGGGANTPTLKNQTVSAIASTSPIYLGMFGLGTQPVNYSSIGNFSAPSYFSSLRKQNIIPSLSWSYTAGAKYRLKAGQYAQLIFGGYDSSRFVPNSANFNLAGDITRDIVVAVQSIVYSGNTQTSLLTTPIYAFIESTDPNFWLPEQACQAFEKAFGISFDNSTGLYLINTTHYTELQTANPTVTFSLANSIDGGEAVNIRLPFSSFALSASYPFTPNDTYYFPLKLAVNETQYTLGRTFLQEAYLTVDYERGNFSVSQCLWNDGATPQVMTISSLSNSTNSGNGTGSGENQQSIKKQVGTGAIVGIVVAVLVILAIAGALAYVFLWRKRSPPPVELPAQTIALEEVSGSDPEEGTRFSFPPDKKSDILPGTHPLDQERSELSTIPDPASYNSQQQRSELPATTEIFQLAERDNREGNYDDEAGLMNSSKKATATSELPGSEFRFELEADPVTNVAPNETRSRDLLSSPAPTLSTRHSQSTIGGDLQSPDDLRSPFDLVLPVSPQSVIAARGQSRSPAQSEQISWLAISPSNSLRHANRTPSIPNTPVTERAMPANAAASSGLNSRWFNTRRADSPRTRDRTESLTNLYNP